MDATISCHEHKSFRNVHKHIFLIDKRSIFFSFVHCGVHTLTCRKFTWLLSLFLFVFFPSLPHFTQSKVNKPRGVTEMHTIHLADLESTCPEGAVKVDTHRHTHCCLSASEVHSRTAESRVAEQHVVSCRDDFGFWLLFTAALSQFVDASLNTFHLYEELLCVRASLSLFSSCVCACVFVPRDSRVAWQRLIFVNMFVFCHWKSPQGPADNETQICQSSMSAKHHGS